MIKQKYIDLMNQEFDGTNSAAQSQELEQYLGSHPEARTYYRELAQAVGVFEKVDMLNPPPGLRDSILAQLDKRPESGRTAPSSPGRKGILAAGRDLFRLRLQPAYAFTFMGGLVLGLALFAGSEWLTSGRGPEQVGFVSGTASHRVLKHEGALLEALSYPGLSGLYRIQREGKDLRLHLELTSLKPAVVKFRFGPNTVLQNFHSDNPSPTALRSGRSAAEISHEGDGSYDLLFRHDQEILTPITMSVFSEGGLIHSDTLCEPEK